MAWYLLGAAVLVLVVWWVMKAKAKPKSTCRNWKAWHDRMPGPGRNATLHVRGECSFPAAGYSVELVRHAPQGPNPAYLLLDKVVRPPSRPTAQVITDVSVEYSEATVSPYRFVTILPEDATIPVEQVQ